MFTTSYEDPIVLLDTEATDQNEPAVNKLQPTSGSTVISAANTTPNKPRFHRIKRDRNYSCYICDGQFEMQGSFVAHHNEQHPDSCFKCEFCDAYYETCNGLFKHQRSHLYMKYKCKDCDKFFQFPYRLGTTSHSTLELVNISVAYVLKVSDPNALKTSTRKLTM